MSTTVTPSLAEYVRLDQKVDEAEGDGIMARWEFGRTLVIEREAHGGKQLPHGRLDELCKATGKDRSELQYRARFAERYPTAEEVWTAVHTFRSWTAIRDSLSGNVHFSSDSDEWETPQDIFDALDDEFGFDVDVCATADNAKCDVFWEPADDPLGRDWERQTCWMNPPYSKIDEWMAKALAESEKGATVVCLVPARTDTGWWWQHARYGEIRFKKGRLKFGSSDASAPFPSAVVVLGHEPNLPDSAWWD